MERAQKSERANECRACERGIWVEGKLAYEIKGAGDSAGDEGGGGQMGEVVGEQAVGSEHTSAV